MPFLYSIDRLWSSLALYHAFVCYSVYPATYKSVSHSYLFSDNLGGVFLSYLYIEPRFRFRAVSQTSTFASYPVAKLRGYAIGGPPPH